MIKATETKKYICLNKWDFHILQITVYLYLCTLCSTKNLLLEQAGKEKTAESFKHNISKGCNTDRILNNTKVNSAEKKNKQSW